jgi:hypothetical protein
LPTLSDLFTGSRAPSSDKLPLIMSSASSDAARSLRQRTLDLLSSVAGRKEALASMFRVHVVDGLSLTSSYDGDRRIVRVTDGQRQFIVCHFEGSGSLPCAIRVTDPQPAGWFLPSDSIQCPENQEFIVECLLAAGLSCRGRYRESITRLEEVVKSVRADDPALPDLKFFIGGAAIRDYWDVLQFLDTVPDRWNLLPDAISAYESGLAAGSASSESAARAVAWNNAGWALSQGSPSARSLEKALGYLERAAAFFRASENVEESGVPRANTIRVRQRLDRIYTETRPLVSDVALAREQAFEILEIPKGPVAFPDLQIAHRLIRATTIAGDFYNLIFRKDRALGVLLVDVEGHGIPAMQQAQGIRQAMFRPGAEWGQGNPVEELEIADRRIEEEVGGRGWAAPMSYTVIDPSTSTILHANAGMPHPLLFSRAGAAPVPLVAKGAYVGAGYSSMPGPSRLASAEFAPGDLLVIFSDGIPESRNTSGTTFGVDGIVRTVAAAGTGAPEFILQEIVRAVAEFTGETAPADDQTLLVISREI